MTFAHGINAPIFRKFCQNLFIATETEQKLPNVWRI